jgi:hypothetical protein
MRSRRHIGNDLLVRDLRQGQLKQPDGLATIGHRHGQQSATAGPAHVDPLCAQHPPVHSAGQFHRHSVLNALELNRSHARSKFAETHDRTAAEISDQETHRVCADHGSQLVRDHLDRFDR